MANCINKGLIEIVGISNNLPTDPTDFIEIILEEDLTIPEQKPDVEQIVKVIANAEILATNVVTTPVVNDGASPLLDGDFLTGFILTIEGVICQKVQYVADEPEQSVHSAHFNCPFSTFITLPTNLDPSGEIKVTPFIEDISIKQVNERELTKCVTLFLNADVPTIVEG